MHRSHRAASAAAGLRRVLAIVPALALLSFAAPPAAHADTIVQFALQGIEFADGSYATGTFTVDESLEGLADVTQIDIDYVSGTAGISSVEFTDPALAYEENDADLYLENASGSISMAFVTNAPYNDSDVTLAVYQIEEFTPKYVILQETGSPPGAEFVPLSDSLPEPSALVLFGGALGCLAFIRRRMRNAAAPAPAEAA